MGMRVYLRTRHGADGPSATLATASNMFEPSTLPPLSNRQDPSATPLRNSTASPRDRAVNGISPLATAAKTSVVHRAPVTGVLSVLAVCTGRRLIGES